MMDETPEEDQGDVTLVNIHVDDEGNDHRGEGAHRPVGMEVPGR